MKPLWWGKERSIRGCADIALFLFFLLLDYVGGEVVVEL